MSSQQLPAKYSMLLRWHFYAAIFVLPLLVVLSLTGLVYLYKVQIESYLYAEQLYVSVPEGQTKKPLQELHRIAQQTLPNTIFTIEVHEPANRSAQFIYTDDKGGKASLFINPYSGEVLANMPTLKQNATYLVGMARQLHRNLLMGKNGHIVMELVACWTLIMMMTGWGLWWVRKKREGLTKALLPRTQSNGRILWMQWHSFLGVVLSLGIVFFVMTGMPWTSVWGTNFKNYAAQVNLGFPPIPEAASGHEEHQHEQHHKEIKLDDLGLENKAWGAGLLVIPHSAGHSHHDAISLDQVLEIAHQHDIQENFSIVAPKDEKGVFTVSYYPSEPTKEKVLNIDQYTGEVINQLSYQDYGVIAKVIEHGVYLHMGTYFGWLNQLLCAVITLGLVGLCVTGVVMWKKRSHGSGLLNAPLTPKEVPSMWKWVLGLAVFGVIFPLAGISLLVVYLLDRLYLHVRQ